jgi:hypothetical protein
MQVRRCYQHQRLYGGQRCLRQTVGVRYRVPKAVQGKQYTHTLVLACVHAHTGLFMHIWITTCMLMTAPSRWIMKVSDACIREQLCTLRRIAQT